MACGFDTGHSCCITPEFLFRQSFSVFVPERVRLYSVISASYSFSKSKSCESAVYAFLWMNAPTGCLGFKSGISRGTPMAKPHTTNTPSGSFSNSAILKGSAVRA